MERYQSLTRMCLNNWHYISRKVLSFHDEINFFTGHSGSGKSTVLDALQVVLYADTNGRNFFNKAAKEDSDRSLIEYLRGMKTVQDNGEAGYLRNQNFSSTIALEFTDTVTGDSQCIGVAFDVDTSTNDVTRLFFRHTGSLPENDYRAVDHVLSTNEVRDYLKQNYPKEDIYYSRTNEAFRNQLFDTYFGGMDEKKFISLFRRAIPFKMDMKLEDFVKEYICMEQDIHIEDMQESVTQYVRLKRRLEDVKKEIELLENVETSFGEYDSKRTEANQYQYNYNKLEIKHLKEKADYLVERQKNYADAITVQSEKKELAKKQVDQLQKDLVDVLLAIEKSDYKHFEQELESLNQMLDREMRSKKEYDDRAKNLQEWIKEIQVSDDVKEQIKAFTSYTLTKEQLSLLKQTLSFYHEKFREEKDTVSARTKELKEEIDSIQSEIRQLQHGEKAYPPYLTEVRDKLQQMLTEKYGEKVTVSILADLMEIPDDTWRNAIEGYLGNNKLSLMVAPEYAKKALELYQKMDARRVFQVSVVDTEQVMKKQKEPMEQALANEVTSNVPYAKAYVDFLLGAVIKCGSIEELRQQKSGITADCLLYQNFKLQHINPKNYKEQAYIGKNAMEQKIQLLKNNAAVRLEQLRPMLSKLEVLTKRMGLEMLDISENTLDGYLTDIREIAEQEQKKVRLEDKIKQLKENNMQQWLEKRTDIEQKMQEKKKEEDAITTNLITNERNLASTKEAFVSINQTLVQKQSELVENEQLEEGYAKYLEEAGNKRIDRMQDECLRKSSQFNEEAEERYQGVIAVREQYNKLYAFRGFSITDKNNDSYNKLLTELRSNKLNDFMERAGKQAESAVKHFKADFIYKIRDAIKQAIQQKDELNQVLNKLDFGKDKYHFVITKSKGEEGKFYDMFMDENLEVNPASLDEKMGGNQLNLFSYEHNQKYNDYMNELLDLFMPPESSDPVALEEARRNLERYADYRTYLSFDMEQRIDGMPVMRLSKMLSKNSGGEGQNPLYVALLASFAQIYRINVSSKVRRRPTPRLVVLDEAFSKMDGEKVGSCIGLIRKLGVQAIISATNDKIQNYVDNVNKTFVFANPNKSNISIQEFEKKDFNQLVDHESNH